MGRKPIVLTGVITLHALLFTLHVQADPLAENQARIGVITGDVGFLSQGAKDWIEPHEGLPIEPGDRIRTGEDGRVELIIGENVLWTLEPETEVVSEHIETNAGHFNLEAGSVTGRVDSGRTAGTLQRWEFNTPMLVATILGTEFALSFSKTEGSRLGVFEGTVELQPAETAEGLPPAMRVTGGQETLVARKKPIKTTAKFSPAMQALAAKRTALRRRQTQIQDTWSPFTTTVREEARKKFVAAPPKRPHVHPPAPRVRHKSGSQDSAL